MELLCRMSLKYLYNRLQTEIKIKRLERLGLVTKAV